MKTSKFYRSIPILLCGIGSFFILYFIYLSIVYGLFYISFSWIHIGIGLVCIAYGALELFLKKHLLSYLNRPLRILTVSLLSCCFVFFIYMESAIIFRGNHVDSSQQKTVIVLGAQLNGNSISRLLRYRLESTVEYATTYPDSTIVVSGGKGVGETRSEASAMKEYLLKKGIAENRIIIEDTSTNTEENFAFSKQIAKTSQISVITNDFHMYRALYLCEKQGMQCSAYPARSDDDLMINFYLREFFASIKDMFL